MKNTQELLLFLRFGKKRNDKFLTKKAGKTEGGVGFVKVYNYEKIRKLLHLRRKYVSMKKY